MHVLPAVLSGHYNLAGLVPTSNPTVAKFLSVTLEDVHLPFTSSESTSVARVGTSYKISREFRNTEFYYKFTVPMDLKI